ncbi:IclR family transcriptional regulator [Nonomuraea sp. SYSU D8015]|uniref:IclR family transcriptional regulator n=1 Tax=Nonomuraea sp. SYSU D8015 TaxID=2593644 RepID=UPI0016618441|nr:IclR family transcriptional regulator [Nonomuraea sp. SYSU D8015]
MTGNDKGLGPSGAAKVMSIFKSFAGDQTELSLTEICERTQLTSSTAHRWLQDLVLQGALVRLPSGRYCLSRLMWEIGTRCPHASILREIAMPVLQNLYRMTRGHVQLAMPAGDGALLVERLSKNLPVKPVGRVGGRMPLHATGAGKVILAYSPVEMRKRILSRKLTRYTDHTITSPQQLKAELKAIRERGYAICYEERLIGIDSYAFPIFEHGSDSVVVAAVSVLVGAGQREADGLINALRSAASQISRALRKTPLVHPFDGL